MIPHMTDPLGKYWDQPHDIRDAPMDEELVLLTPAQFSKLSEYSATMPSGVYPGKCWKAEEYKRNDKGHFAPTGRWMLRWYGDEFEEGGKKFVSNNQRIIEVVN